MEIQGKEYLQIGYDANLFERVQNSKIKRLRKTAVDPKPNKLQEHRYPKSQSGDYKHHIFHESFIQFARYIPNKYDLIHFTKGATDYEIKLAETILSKGGEILVD